MKKRIRAPAPHEVLTTSEVARWLQVSPRTVERHYPSFAPGRYLAAHILARLDAMARERAARQGLTGPLSVGAT